jgi:phosphatidate cytidylyltransferase
MLKTRIVTALALLAVLLPVLLFNNFAVFAVIVTVFFGAAIWEAFRLFNPDGKRAALIAVFWTAAFAYGFFFTPGGTRNPQFWFPICVAIWVIRFAPSLKMGLPPMESARNTILSMLYAIAVVGCFAAIVELFRHSPVYLLSVMALVWIADIGAYFSGKAFGKRKLAPSISPGKSWEGAIGGCIAVLVIASGTILFAGNNMYSPLADTFAVRLEFEHGWAVTILALVAISAASVVGDLFESQLKRRAGFKDSSALLPGHGGVLDRIDALIPVLPLAALIGAWH